MHKSWVKVVQACILYKQRWQRGGVLSHSRVYKCIVSFEPRGQRGILFRSRGQRGILFQSWGQRGILFQFIGQRGSICF